MKVLVTGATGFVGRHVVSSLLEEGISVVAMVRDTRKARSFDWCDRVQLLSHDIHSSKPLELDASVVPDAVMHLAWAGLPNYDAMFHIEENLPASYRFIKGLVKQGVAHILVAGTCLEYGIQYGPINESAPCNPSTPYAQAKDSLHKFLRALQQEEPFMLTWARLFYMYGEGQRPNSLLAQLDQAIKRGEKVFNMTKGEQLRDYLPVETAAHKLVALLKCKDADGSYNVCSGHPISIRRLVEGYLERRGAEIQLNLGYYPYLEYEPMAFWGDSRKLDLLLGGK